MSFDSAAEEDSSSRSVSLPTQMRCNPSLRIVMQTLEEAMALRVQAMRTVSPLLGVLGGLALIMASVGIYAILAYAVSQGTKEIGIRAALGAQRREILSLVMQRTIVEIGWGIALGLAGAIVLSRILSNQLADLGGLDAITCASAALPLAVAAACATYVPARKALGVDPVQALRCD